MPKWLPGSIEGVGRKIQKEPLGVSPQNLREGNKFTD
jgi:hypothetical protein